jgi:probable F420-dependent oxidoreductase
MDPSMTPFRFAVQTNEAPDVATWRERARTIESLGYSTLYVPDHFTTQWGPLVALTVAAEATTTLNVGALVFDNDYRHPVVLAKEIATLALVSEGRVEFGLGAGWMRTDYEESGIPYDEPPVRIDRLEEALAVYEQLWDGPATFAGEHYVVTGATAAPAPLATGRPKLVIGGGGKRVLSIAARHADIVGVNPSLRSGAVDAATAQSAVVELYEQRIEWIREAAGDRFEDLELQVLTFIVAVDGDRDEVAKMMAPGLGITEAQARAVPIALVGSVEEICDQLVERRERMGLSYWVVHDPEVEAFAAVVDRLAGT